MIEGLGGLVGSSLIDRGQQVMAGGEVEADRSLDRDTVMGNCLCLAPLHLEQSPPISGWPEVKCLHLEKVIPTPNCTPPKSEANRPSATSCPSPPR